MTGFEPVTPCSQNRYSTKLSHIPIRIQIKIIIFLILFHSLQLLKITRKIKIWRTCFFAKNFRLHFKKLFFNFSCRKWIQCVTKIALRKQKDTRSKNSLGIKIQFSTKNGKTSETYYFCHHFNALIFIFLYNTYCRPCVPCSYSLCRAVFLHTLITLRV